MKDERHQMIVGMIVGNRFNLKLFCMKVLLPAFMLLTTIVNAQNDFTSIHYRGIRPGDRNGMIPLRNPGRGFRLEDRIDLSTFGNLFKTGSDPAANLKSEALKYGSDSVSLVLTSLYLPAVDDKSIADSALLRMQIYFDTIRKLGLKSVLHLSYKTDSAGSKGPELAVRLHHLDQLQFLLRKNMDVILVVQAGMMGRGSDRGDTKNLPVSDNATQLALLKKLLSIVPPPLQIQVRLPEIKNLISVGDPGYDRIGFYDDRVVIKPDKMDGGLHEGTPSFEQTVREVGSTQFDGELPWGAWSVGKDGFLIDGYNAALRFRLQHFTSLSLIHNNKEDGDEKKYSMDYWRNVPANPEALRADKMPFSEDYFTASSGNIVQRPVFDYIRADGLQTIKTTLLINNHGYMENPIPPSTGNI